MKHLPFLAYGYFFLVVISLFGCSNSSEKKTEPLGSAELYVTSLDQTQLLKATPLFDNISEEVAITITIDDSKTFQEIDGFGYTLNGGSALHIQNMSTATRAGLLQELFATDVNSIGVSYLRVSIGASDLDEGPWSYNDLPDGETDIGLEQFSLAYDTLYLIPTLKEIIKISPQIKIMGSPWSPPSWMKDNNDTKGGSLKPEYYAVYANYLVRYIQEMSKEGILIDALTIQNEPLHPGNNPSLLMLADQQTEFIKNHLGPVFQENGINTKIIIYDHNADRPDYPIAVLNDAEAAKFIDGSAFHLYGGSIDALSEVQQAHPTKNIYFTEQWVGAPGNFAEDFSWHMENLIIGATRNWSKTVLEWNLAADENQKPHTDRGGCDRCLGALTISGDVVVRNPAYYIIAQATKFVPPGSIRIASNLADNIPNVAFKTPLGKVVIIVQNKFETSKKLKIKSGTKDINFTLEASSVASLIL